MPVIIPFTSSFITGGLGQGLSGTSVDPEGNPQPRNRLEMFQKGYKDNWAEGINNNFRRIVQIVRQNKFRENDGDITIDATNNLQGSNGSFVAVTGTLDFGSSNVWMTRSVVVRLSESFDLNMVGKFWLPGGYGNTRVPGTTQIPVFWQSAATSKPTKIIQCDLTTTNDWDLDATNWWRFRIKSSSSLGLSNKVTYETETKDLRAFVPTPMMQEVTQFELQNGVNEVLIFEAARRGSNAPLPVWNPTLKITYVVANDASTFDV